MYRTLMAVTCVAVSGCSATIPPAQLATPEHLVPIQSNPDQSKTIYVANVRVKLIDKNIGQLKGGTLCIGGTKLLWTDNQGVLNTIREQMANSLSKHGYRVYAGLIETKGERESDIVIGTAIEDIRANICYSVEGSKGAASLTLKWEVLDNRSNKSIFLHATGAANISKFSTTSDPDVFLEAARMAVDNLLAQQAFYRATRK
jgi:hypothetical protein